MPELDCPCGTGDPYDECCGPLHRRAREAATAEELMRSRYSAYVVGDVAHLRRTWHPEHRPEQIGRTGDEQWLGLRVLRIRDGGEHDDRGVVEFVARFRSGGLDRTLHEVSRFVRLTTADDHEGPSGRWVYLRGREVTA